MLSQAQSLSLADVLFSPSFFFALLVYMAASVSIGIIHYRFSASLQDATYIWLWEHFYLPLLRAGVIILFLFVGYPVIFGVADAPTVEQIMDTESGRLGRILGVVFFLSLAAPLAPVRLSPALLLPAQGIAASAMLLSWLASTVGIHDLSLWPGWGTGMTIVLFAIASHWLAGHLGYLVSLLGRYLLEREGLEELLEDTVLLLFQVPGIVLYSTTVGRQLAGLN